MNFSNTVSENNYDVCIESMFKLKRFGIKLGLSTIKKILKELGNPQNNFYSIHIAGTNGKGSVASSLSKIIQSSGYNVGLYTSPHILKFNERICINSVPVDDEAIVKAWEVIKSIRLSNRKLTFFEFSTAMALYEFNRRNVDFAVIETGMGGSHDATNVIIPIITIITNISLEHKEYLGNTIQKISKEKAGILKEKIPVISSVKQESARTLIREIATKNNSEFLLKGRDFRIRKKNDNTFSYFGKYNKWGNMRTSLRGEHQIENAATVLAACEILNRSYPKINIDSIRSGLFNNEWQGRLELVLKNPDVILDGAHNLMAARKLGKFLKSNFSSKKITLVVGILEDKSYKSMLKNIVKHCHRIIVTKPNIERALNLKEIKKIANNLHGNVIAIRNVSDAISYAINTVNSDEVVCVAGSLYVVGEAKKYLIYQYELNERV